MSGVMGLLPVGMVPFCSARYWRFHLLKRLSLIPASRAAWARVYFLSVTSLTVSILNSGVYRLRVIRCPFLGYFRGISALWGLRDY